ncbi:hypothetical protein KY327_00295 [Candidatus Woesearchaeota archaeon]|nr:hypothetical protein [Candidatus Woesearchaeota archaeon]
MTQHKYMTLEAFEQQLEETSERRYRFHELKGGMRAGRRRAQELYQQGKKEEISDLIDFLYQYDPAPRNAAALVGIADESLELGQPGIAAEAYKHSGMAGTRHVQRKLAQYAQRHI